MACGETIALAEIVLRNLFVKIGTLRSNDNSYSEGADYLNSVEPGAPSLVRFNLLHMKVPLLHGELLAGGTSAHPVLGSLTLSAGHVVSRDISAGHLVRRLRNFAVNRIRPVARPSPRPSAYALVEPARRRFLNCAAANPREKPGLIRNPPDALFTPRD